MFLREVEEKEGEGGYGDLIRSMRASGMPHPQIWHLFAYKPEITRHLERFTHGVMHEASPLSAGLRELIAAFTSSRNACPF